MKRWVVQKKKADFTAIGQKYGISPLLARIIRNRNVIEDKDINDFLNGKVQDMHDPSLLKDIDKAAERIALSIRNHERIRIIGDYDIDGICSSYILKKSFALLGASVDVRLPDRVLDGYGLNKNMIDEAKADGVSLIVTCDNGIAAYKEIEYANESGIDVVVTDHHEVPYDECDGKKYILPPAVAVVDPKREDCNYPFDGICGGMVAYKLIVYITSNAKYDDLTKEFTSKVMEELLVFAAFATVGDVMELLDENRIAVKHGLKAMAEIDNVGLRALIEATGLDKNHISAYHIGFVLGPCMNATGRLDTAQRALELLSESDYEKAVLISGELKALNESRKNMTVMYSEEAIRQAENMTDNVLVIFLPDCHESLAGIVAGRVRERFYKPTIVLTKGSEGVKGSGRSIEDYNMFEELSKVSDLFIKFGGHKMAAGLSLEEKNIDLLRKRLNENCHLSEEQLTEKVVIDIDMPIEYATLSFAREIDELAPFGMGNSKPLFAQKDVPFDNLRLIGKNQNVLKMTLYSKNSMFGSASVEGIIYSDAVNTYEKLLGRDTITIAYQVDVNSFRGKDSVQLVIKDYI